MFCLELGAHIMIALVLQIPFQHRLKWPGVYPYSMRRCSTSQFQYSDRHLLLKITGASTLAMPTTPHPRNSTKLRVTVLQQDSLKMAACIFCKIIKGKSLFLSALLGFINDQ